ncbi:alpha/beta fold hydrolase [Nocardia tengchongensis]|uniref:alpha/beta fold hydrolase n=1 Tax=Nocardia tengchongensis TaxID=2055889 RepID=UPI0036494C07
MATSVSIRTTWQAARPSGRRPRGTRSRPQTKAPPIWRTRTKPAPRIVSQFEPESQHLYRDGVSARTFPARLGYVVTSSDRVIPAADQRRHATELSAEFRSELSTGHLPMLQDPALLARIVGEFKTER